MKLIFSEDRERLYRWIVDQLEEVIDGNPSPLIGLATGATFEPVYQRLIPAIKDRDLSGLHTVNLDEYYPIQRNAPQSFYSYMRSRVFEPLGLDSRQTLVLNGETSDPKCACQAFEAYIRERNGIDLQLLGIGRNGHIGFNEPSHVFEMETHLTQLSDVTIKDNLRYFKSKDSMPLHALTMGIGTIMSAKSIVLLAVGESKKSALQALISGKITPQLPASILKLHPDCTVLIDALAGEDLDWSLGTRI